MSDADLEAIRNARLQQLQQQSGGGGGGGGGGQSQGQGSKEQDQKYGSPLALIFHSCSNKYVLDNKNAPQYSPKSSNPSQQIV